MFKIETTFVGKICCIHNLFVSIFISWSLMLQLRHLHKTKIKYKRFSYQRSRIDQLRLHAAKTNPMKHKFAVVVENKYKVYEFIAAIKHLT